MRKFWVASLGLIALLTACSSGVTPAGPAATPAPRLTGTSWTVTAINGTAPITGNEPTMEFSDTTVAGTASCNRYNAAYTQDVAKVTITPGALTAMACAEDVMAQEQAFNESLAKVTGVRTAGEGAELVDADGNVVLALAKVVDQPLEGTKWTLTGIISGEAVASPVAESTVTLTITNGELQGKACNSFRGTVTAGDDGSFKAGPLMSTKMACTSEELNKQETTVLTTLQAAAGYTIKGDQLTITADDGTGLVFTAA